MAATPVYGHVESTSCYTVEQLALIMGGCDRRLISSFLRKHGYQPAMIGRGYHQISGYVWNLCIQKEMLTASEPCNQEND